MKILLAIDGSTPALHAARFALRLLQGQPQPPAPHALTLVSVHDDTGLRHAKAFVGQAAVAEYLRERSDVDLKSARRLLDRAGQPYDTDVRTGHIAEQILRCATQGHFDLVALGAKGRGAVRDLLMGSVAQRVLAGAPMPVVLVR